MNFKDMLECVSQHAQGLIADHELILSLQCSHRQVEALLTVGRLPLKVFSEIKLEDFDESIADARERECAGQPTLIQVDGGLYRSRANIDYKYAAAEAIALALSEDRIIHFVFNGHLSAATKDSTPEQMFQQYILYK